MTIIIIFALIFGTIGAAMADKRDRSTVAWAIICALTGLIGLFILAVIGRADRA